MKKILPFILLFFACNEPEIQEVHLIPKPQNISINQGVFELNLQTGIVSDSLFLAEVNYLKDLLNLPLNGQANHIILHLKEGLGKEEFFLDISYDNLKIEASTPVGIMRGIQTLRQLLPRGNKTTMNIPSLSIHDYPRFVWRGMLLDCCRHFMDVEFVKRYIDLLAYYKMNVLHWHLTEDQGWRVEIDKYPNLTKIGAWRIEKNGEE